MNTVQLLKSVYCTVYCGIAVVETHVDEITYDQIRLEISATHHCYI